MTDSAVCPVCEQPIQFDESVYSWLERGRRGDGVSAWHGQMPNPRSTGSDRRQASPRRTAINLLGR